MSASVDNSCNKKKLRNRSLNKQNLSNFVKFVKYVKCLDRVLRTAARLVGRIPRFGRVSGYMRDVLHWLPSLPTAHCLPHLCVGSALHGGTGPILSPGTLLLHCYYSASYLITLFCP